MTYLFEGRQAEAIDNFAGKRLAAYYLENPLMAQPVTQALSNARSLISNNPIAGFSFTAIAVATGREWSYLLA